MILVSVAKFLEHSKTKTQTQVPGTLHFMPPEALANKPHYGKLVDVFSLGCVACLVMSHQWPEPKHLLPEDSMTALTEVQRREDYLLSCAKSLKQLVESCLHNKPEQRPEISVVSKRLKELKDSVDEQTSLAATNIVQILDAVQQEKLRNQTLHNNFDGANVNFVECIAELKAEVKETEKKMEKLLEINQTNDMIYYMQLGRTVCVGCFPLL